MPAFVLASTSPRRIELLGQFGVPFEVVPSSAEELHDHGIPAADLCRTNALRKAEAVARQFPDAIVLGADTLVTGCGKHFGKPRSIEEAEQMLSELSGRAHEVITGVALRHDALSKHETVAVQTSVTFRPLPDEVIREYIRVVPVLDKAGSYAIQDRGEWLIESIEGSLTNVIGLPVERLAEALCAWGLINPRERDRIAASQPVWHPGKAARRS